MHTSNTQHPNVETTAAATTTSNGRTHIVSLAAAAAAYEHVWFARDRHMRNYSTHVVRADRDRFISLVCVVCVSCLSCKSHGSSKVSVCVVWSCDRPERQSPPIGTRMTTLPLCAKIIITSLSLFGSKLHKIHAKTSRKYHEHCMRQQNGHDWLRPRLTWFDYYYYYYYCCCTFGVHIYICI